MGVRSWAVTTAFLAVVPLCGAADTVIEDFEDLSEWRVKGKKIVITPSDQPAVGTNAIALTISTFPGLAFRRLYDHLPPTGHAEWDACDGFSFYAKGDGSDLYGCLALCGEDWLWSQCHVYYFPLSSTSWQKYTVRWEELVPETGDPCIGRYGGLPPSGIQHVRLGDRWTIWHNNAKIPPLTYQVDQIEVVKSIPCEYRLPRLRKLEEALANLPSNAPFHIVCMGDSITAGTALKEPDTTRYAALTQMLLRHWLKRDNIIVESRAVGSARSTDLRAWVNRDLRGKAPDLVTILVGYNDKSHELPIGMFRRSLNDYIDRIIRKTDGKTAIVLIPTIPGRRHRFTMMDDYADAVRAIGRKRHIAVCDVQKVFKTRGRAGVEKLFADLAHPNEAGHELIADTLSRFLMERARLPLPDETRKHVSTSKQP